MQLDYTVETSKSFAEAVAAVEAASKEHGFGVLHIHDVQATLAAKGFAREPLKILEICNGGFAHRVLQADVKIALMLPCPVVVYVADGQTFISALRPDVMGAFYPAADIQAVAEEVNAHIIAIVDAAK